MSQLKLVVDTIVYQNKEAGFTVVRGFAKYYSDIVTVVGDIPVVFVGSVLYMRGEWKIDSKYGKQFHADDYVHGVPATLYGIQQYLGSGLIKGIGRIYAARIVELFGKETVSVLDNEPDRLLEVQGISTHRLDAVKKSWKEQKEIRNIMLFLQKYNISAKHAFKIWRQYGNESIEMMQINPYSIADSDWGIGFTAADYLADKLKFNRFSYARLYAGLLYVLSELASKGHCYATQDMLLQGGKQLLKADDAMLSDTLIALQDLQDVIVEDVPNEDDLKAIYLPSYHHVEVDVAKRLIDILRSEGGFYMNPNELLKKVEEKTGVSYDLVQKRAIVSSVSMKVLVLTGGPGTGKTTTIQGIIAAYQTVGANVLLAAPTGRAAKRLTEVAGMQAVTVHRLLDAQADGFKRNAENPLKGDVLIVDECSMLDILLMHNLLKAIPDGMSLVLVGDVGQLPSVGAGNVLRDIIASDCVPVVKLTQIYRQSQQSRIVKNAYRINDGQMPDISNGKDSDFFYVDMDRLLNDIGVVTTDGNIYADETISVVVNLVKEKLPKYYDVPSKDIQVLVPMQRGAAGAVNINKVLQHHINPGENGLRSGDFLYKVNDKVMQVRNNYEKKVFNGDVGIVQSIDYCEHKLTVDFDGRLVQYEYLELDELSLAYAITVHKSQGSEYPIVVIPLIMNYFSMLQRNLIYTAITRAKKIVVIVGTRDALSYAVNNTSADMRNSMLCDRLKDL